MNLTEARENVGAAVVYRGHPGSPAEDGTIIRVTDAHVFVRYSGSETPKATRAHDLELLVGGAV